MTKSAIQLDTNVLVAYGQAQHIAHQRVQVGLMTLNTKDFERYADCIRLVAF